ncbi:hypothetical protein [Solemya pervernicosa gill symbiont]|nr:hypothetical protein [Solemya pervernicosa gill symbiont]
MGAALIFDRTISIVQAVGDEATVEASILFQGVELGYGVHLNRCLNDKG